VKVPRRERLSVLFSTLRRGSERKVVIVCSTRESRRFHAALFRQLEMARVYELREDGGGDDDDDVGDGEYDGFVRSHPGMLFASEASMAGGGPDALPPDVDYLIQYEPPSDPAEYVRRTGEARLGPSSCRKSLLFLAPDEMGFLDYFGGGDGAALELEARRVSKFRDVAEELVSRHAELNEYARDACASFLVAYGNHSRADVYDRARLDEGEVERSFGRPYHRDAGTAEDRPSSALAIVANNGNNNREARAETTTGAVVANGRAKSERPESIGGGGQKPHWMTKEKTWRERKGQRKSWKKNEHDDDGGGGRGAKEKADRWRAHFGTERTWRTGHTTKSWMTKEKTWKHSHVHL
jgi:superfamily II DNA/RNA helicase